MADLAQSLLVQLNERLKQTSLALSDLQKQQLVDYVLLLHKWNKAYNLTSVREPQEMLVKHILDSIVVAPQLTGKNYIDVGTGPGLPGIPLSIVCPDKQFILLDSLGKRIRFLNQVVFTLKLTNVKPVQSRVEDFRPESELDGVLSRAFASLKDMLHWCQHLVDSKGTFLALKGQLLQQEIDQLPDGFCIQDKIELQVPGLEGQRHLIKIQKTD